jgi:hypothetical protein
VNTAANAPTPRHPLAALLREPLLQFLLLGALIFLLDARLGEAEPEQTERTIVLDAGDITRLTEQFRRTWMRPPTPAELDGLLAETVREEVLYREALALGLDRDDPIVRRRLRQKMEFLNADLVADAEPTDAELADFLAANPEPFRRPPRFDLAQVFIDPRRHADPAAHAARLLERLRRQQPPEPAALGDATLLPAGLAHASPRDIAETYGRELADAAADLAPGTWHGPLRSGYGLHLVRVEQVAAGGLPPLDEIRGAVAREWQQARRKEADERFYQALRARWTVEIDAPADPPATTSAGGATTAPGPSADADR